MTSMEMPFVSNRCFWGVSDIMEGRESLFFFFASLGSRRGRIPTVLFVFVGGWLGVRGFTLDFQANPKLINLDLLEVPKREMADTC